MGAAGAQINQLLPQLLTLGATIRLAARGQRSGWKCVCSPVHCQRRIGQPTMSRSCTCQMSVGKNLAVEECPKSLQPLAEPQYSRGVLDASSMPGLDPPGVPAIERWRVRAWT